MSWLLSFCSGYDGLKQSSRPDFDILTWDGTVSPSDFRVVALDFAEKWKRFNTTTIPQWSWVPCSKRPWIVARQVSFYPYVHTLKFLFVTLNNLYLCVYV